MSKRCGPPCCAPCKMRYIQPARPESFKPVRVYVPPTEAIEGCTIYKKSFCPPCCTDGCRPPPMRAHDNIQPACCKMDGNTTHKMSFKCPPPCAKAPCPVLPCNRNVIGEGPLSCLTTARHDYVPKPMIKLMPIVPPTQLRCSEKPLEDVTIMNASYQPPCKVEPVCSYKPIAVYKHPCHPFQDETVQKLSYVPWPMKRKEHYPWACKGKYTCPQMPMEQCTIMTSSYQDNCGDHRRAPLKHEAGANIISDALDFENCTIYRKSFCPTNCGDCRPPPMRAHDNLKPACCKMDGNTTHKMSFKCPPPCAKRPCPVLPCNRNVVGEGPLSCLTTNRHDYVPKPMIKLMPIVPPTQLRCSEQPLEGTTIMTASYQPPCPTGPQHSYKPIAVYSQPCHKFQDETVNKLSYVPWPLKRKEHYPWACKGKYVCPSLPVEGTSVYQASFFAPGQYVEGGAPCAPCDPCPPAGGCCKASCFGDCCSVC